MVYLDNPFNINPHYTINYTMSPAEYTRVF
jgi:hypothetical protein